MSDTPVLNILKQQIDRRDMIAHGGKLPPQALEMEEAVLGALMLERDAVAKMLSVIKGTATAHKIFYKTQHQVVIEAILSLSRDGDPIDILSVKNKLTETGKLEQAGGIYFLTELTSRVASAANIEYHLRVIAQKWIMRETIRLCTDGMRGGYDETEDPFDLINGICISLSELTDPFIQSSAMTMGDALNTRLSEMRADQQRNLARSVTIPGVPFGIGLLDYYTGGCADDQFKIVAARAAMGKTAFMLTCVVNAARAGFPQCIFSLEMSRKALMNRIISILTGIENQRIQQCKPTDKDWEVIEAMRDEISRLPIIIDDKPGLDIYTFKAKCRRLKAEFGIKRFWVDYLGLMEDIPQPGFGNQQNDHQKLNRIAREMKLTARELNTPIIALAQLSRAVETRGGGTMEKRPQLSDLRESGGLEEHADDIYFLYRPGYYEQSSPGYLQRHYPNVPAEIMQKIMLIIIAKQRNGPTLDIPTYIEKSRSVIKSIQEFDTYRALGAGALLTDSTTGNILENIEEILGGVKYSDQPTIEAESQIPFPF